VEENVIVIEKRRMRRLEKEIRTLGAGKKRFHRTKLFSAASTSSSRELGEERGRGKSYEKGKRSEVR